MGSAKKVGGCVANTRAHQDMVMGILFKNQFDKALKKCIRCYQSPTVKRKWKKKNLT